MQTTIRGPKSKLQVHNYIVCAFNNFSLRIYEHERRKGKGSEQTLSSELR